MSCRNLESHPFRALILQAGYLSPNKEPLPGIQLLADDS